MYVSLFGQTTFQVLLEINEIENRLYNLCNGVIIIIKLLPFLIRANIFIGLFNFVKTKF